MIQEEEDEARYPRHAVELVDQAFTCGDLEALLAFYETGAVVTEPGRRTRGHTELRTFFTQTLSAGRAARQLTTHVIEADGMALFTSRWTLLPAPGNTADEPRTLIATTVLRKQPKGAWQALIDNPFGPLALGPE